MDVLLRAQTRILGLANAEKDRTLAELKRSEHQLREANDALNNTRDMLVEREKMAALGQLVAGVAHEINTPIGVALTVATYLKERADGMAAAVQAGKLKRADLDGFLTTCQVGTLRMHRNLHRAADLIQSFKQVSVDQTSEQRRRFDLKTVLGELMDSLLPQFKSKGHGFEIDCPDGIVMDSYPGALGQVVANLTINAITHAFAPGVEGQVKILVSAQDDQIVIGVQDDGRGIPPTVQAKVFEPFFTTRRSEGGTGLGLQIVFNLVTGVLGGKITLVSAEGRGSRFIVAMPRVPDAPAPAAAPGPSPAVAPAPAPAPPPPDMEKIA